MASLSHGLYVYVLEHMTVCVCVLYMVRISALSLSPSFQPVADMLVHKRGISMEREGGRERERERERDYIKASIYIERLIFFLERFSLSCTIFPQLSSPMTHVFA